MRGESMKVKHVLVELRLDLISLEVLVFGLGGVVLVARVITARRTAVLLPRASAKPAKIVATTTAFLAARHVHAATVLLNVFLALGAALAVGHHPLDIFALVLVLVIPHGH